MDGLFRSERLVSWREESASAPLSFPAGGFTGKMLPLTILLISHSINHLKPNI